MLKKLWIVCCVLLALYPPPKSAGQYLRVGVDGPIPLGKLDEMENMLSLADAGQKAGLLVRLGVDSLIAKVASEHLMAGEKIELLPVRTRGEMHHGIAYLPSGTGVSCYLYLLQGSDENPAKFPWHVIDHQELNCWDGAGSVELMALRYDDVDDVVVHHLNWNHGSGVVEDQTQIFSILSSKLVQTLATRDRLSEVTLGTEDTLDQKGTVVRFPDLSLEETRTSAFNGKLNKVERRYWRWSESRQKFIPTRFLLVVPPHS